MYTHICFLLLIYSGVRYFVQFIKLTLVLHSLGGDTYLCVVLSHKYRHLANVIIKFILGLIRPLFSNISELLAFVKSYNLVFFLTNEPK